MYIYACAFQISDGNVIFAMRSIKFFKMKVRMRIKNIKYLLCILSFISLANCSNNNVKNKDVEEFLAGLEANTTFSLDKVNNKDWNDVYVLHPYTYRELQKYSLTISGDIEKVLEAQCLLDSHCTLLFVKDKVLVNYAFVKRDVADFLHLGTNKNYPSSQQYKMNEKRIVTIE